MVSSEGPNLITGVEYSTPEIWRLMDDRYRTSWRRFGAWLLDVALFAPTVWLVEEDEAWIAVAIAWLMYHAVLHGLCGRTVGKMLCGVTVIRAQPEARLGWRRAIWREVGHLLLLGLVLLTIFLPGWLLFLELFEGDGESDLAFVPLFILWFFGMVAIILLWPLLNATVALGNDRGRTLADLIGGTVVVKGS